MGVFGDLQNLFKTKHMESAMLSDAGQKVLDQAQGNDISDGDMNFKNLGWDTLEKANIAGGVEGDEELTKDEIDSFWKAIAQVYGED